MSSSLQITFWLKTLGVFCGIIFLIIFVVLAGVGSGGLVPNGSVIEKFVLFFIKSNPLLLIPMAVVTISALVIWLFEQRTK